MNEKPQTPNPNDDPYAWLEQPAPWHQRNGDDTVADPPLPNAAKGKENSTSEIRRIPINLAAEAPRISRRQRFENRQSSQAMPYQRKTSAFWQSIRTIGLTFIAALLLATIFSYWTPENDFLPAEFRAQMQSVNQKPIRVATVAVTPLPTPIQLPSVGIIAGHSGPPQDPNAGPVDPGAVCDDNNDGIAELTELEINTDIAQQVVEQLRIEGYRADLFEEFDPRLQDYRADLLISIHTNDCSNYGLGGTGYNVAGASARQGQPHDEYLVRCLIDEYGKVTNLPRHYGVTVDMTSYHTFREVSIDTPVAIIETGFMLLDRPILTQKRDVLAQGVLAGIYCFLAPRGFGPYAEGNQ